MSVFTANFQRLERMRLNTSLIDAQTRLHRCFPETDKLQPHWPGKYTASTGYRRSETQAEQEKEMKIRTRFIKSVINAAKTDITPMPWTRGAHRCAAIAGRLAPQPARKVRIA